MALAMDFNVSKFEVPSANGSARAGRTVRVLALIQLEQNSHILRLQLLLQPH